VSKLELTKQKLLCEKQILEMQQGNQEHKACTVEKIWGSSGNTALKLFSFKGAVVSSGVMQML